MGYKVYLLPLIIHARIQWCGSFQSLEINTHMKRFPTLYGQYLLYLIRIITCGKHNVSLCKTSLLGANNFPSVCPILKLETQMVRYPFKIYALSGYSVNFNMCALVNTKCSTSTHLHGG